jgi:hypothetical protein
VSCYHEIYCSDYTNIRINIAHCNLPAMLIRNRYSPLIHLTPKFPSSDSYYCLPCGNGPPTNSTTFLNPNIAAGSCTCPVGFVLSSFNHPLQAYGVGDFVPSGNFSLSLGKTCMMCPWNSIVSPTDPYTCERCPDPLMRRNAEGVCSCIDTPFEQKLAVRPCGFL